MKKVIIVGNSPTLLNQNLGSRIDEYDKVIRCNFCETKGYENSHGSRTSIWVTSLDDGHVKSFSGPKVIEDKEIWFRTKNDYNPITLESYESNYSDLHENYSFEYLSNHDCGFGPLHDSIKNVIDISIQNQFPQDCGSYCISTGLSAILNGIRHFGKVDIAGFTFYCENDNRDQLIGYMGPVGYENLSKHANYNKIIINHLVDTGKLSYINKIEKDILDGFRV